MTVAILFNPISGAGRAQIVAQTIAHGLSRLGFVTTLMPTQRGPSAQWLRPQLIMVGADAIDVLIVVGGDGAVRQAAFEAAHAKIPLWHAPGGTENLFAQSFGMTCDVDAIAHAMREQHTTTIDLASANDEPFVIMASIGLDAEVVHQLASARMGAISHLSYERPIVTGAEWWSLPTCLATARGLIPHRMRWQTTGRSMRSSFPPQTDACSCRNSLRCVWVGNGT